MKKLDNVLAFRERRALNTLDCSAFHFVSDWVNAMRKADTESLYLAMQRMQSAVTIRAEQTFLNNAPSWSSAAQVLEVAYGLGEVVGSIAPVYPEKKFDQIPFFIDTYRTKSGNHRREYGINQLSSDGFPIEENKYDSVILRWIAQYCADHRQLLQRLRRSMKLGGSLFIIEPVDADAKFSPPIAALDDFYQKLNFFQKASGGNRDVIQAILDEKELQGLEVVSSRKDPVSVFSPDDKDTMARMFTLISEFVERSYKINVNVEQLAQDFVSWQFNHAAWGQVTMQYLEIKRIA